MPKTSTGNMLAQNPSLFHLWSSSYDPMNDLEGNRHDKDDTRQRGKTKYMSTYSPELSASYSLGQERKALGCAVVASHWNDVSITNWDVPRLKVQAMSSSTLLIVCVITRRA